MTRMLAWLALMVTLGIWSWSKFGWIGLLGAIAAALAAVATGWVRAIAYLVFVVALGFLAWNGFGWIGLMVAMVLGAVMAPEDGDAEQPEAEQTR